MKGTVKLKVVGEDFFVSFCLVYANISEKPRYSITMLQCDHTCDGAFWKEAEGGSEGNSRILKCFPIYESNLQSTNFNLICVFRIL